MSVSISGILLDPFGQPASFAEVKFITWQGANDVLTTAPAVFKTSADGAYSFSVEFGTFTVQVRYNQSNGKFQTIKQKVIVNSNVTATTLGELLLFNEPLTPPEIAYVEQLVAEAEGYKDDAAASAAASEASSQASATSAAASAQSATDAANSAALIAPVPLNGGVWASGQTYDFYNQYMIYNGEAYSPLPATVLPYTVGAVPDLGFVYHIRLNDHSLLANLNAVGAHDSIYRRSTTVAEIESGVFTDPKSRFTITDRGNAPAQLVSGGVADGYFILNALNGNTVQIEIGEKIKTEWSGAVGGNASVDTPALQACLDAALDFERTSGVVEAPRGIEYLTDKPLFKGCGVSLVCYSENNQGMSATIIKTNNDTTVAPGYNLAEEGKSNAQDAVIVYATRFGPGYVGGKMNNFSGKGLLSVNLRSTSNAEFGIYGYSINNEDFKDFQIFDVQEGYFSWNAWKQNWEDVLIQDVDRIGTWEYDGIINTTMYFKHFYCHSYRQRAIKFRFCLSVVMDIPIFEGGEGQQILADFRSDIVVNGFHVEYAGTLGSISGVTAEETAHFVASSTSSIVINGGYQQTYFKPTPAGGESAFYYAKDISKITVNNILFDVSSAIGGEVSKGVSFVKCDGRSTVELNNVTSLNTQAQMLGGGANIDNGGSFVVNGGNLTRAYLLKRLGIPCSDAETAKAESPIDAHVDPVAGLPENNGTSLAPKKTFTQVLDNIRHCNNSDFPSAITLRASDVSQDLNISESTIPLTINLNGFSIGTVNIENSRNVTLINGSINEAIISNSEVELDTLTYRKVGNSLTASKKSIVNIKGNSDMTAGTGFNVIAFDGSRVNQYAGTVTGQFSLQTYGGIITVSTAPTGTSENGGGRIFV